MKRLLQIESLETRRTLSTNAILDLWNGPLGSRPFVLGTLGRSVVAEISHPDCSNRCLASLDAIDHTLTLLGEMRVFKAIEEPNRIIAGTDRGVVVTDGTPAGTQTLAGDPISLVEDDGVAYWSEYTTIGEDYRLDIHTADGIISSFEGPIGVCTFDGCDFASFIGAVNGDYYYQITDSQSGFGQMLIYRNDNQDRLFAFPWMDIPFSPLFKATSIGDSVHFELETPARKGLLDSLGEVVAMDLEQLIYADDSSVVWIETDSGAHQYDPINGMTELLLEDLEEIMAAYNLGHAREPLPVVMANVIAYDPVGYLVLSQEDETTGSELAIWTPAVGDSNYDTVFDSSDLIAVFQSGLYETTQTAFWMEGDWNYDGTFDSSDLVMAFQMGVYQA